MNHHVHRRNDGTTDRTTYLLISSNVHYVHRGGDNKPKVTKRSSSTIL